MHASSFLRLSSRTGFSKTEKLFCAIWLVVALALASFQGQTAAAASVSPEVLVTRFHETLLQTMKDAEKLGLEGRYASLAPSISEAFHLQAMIQIASGSYWRKATDQEKEQLAEGFSKLTIATYAAQFDGYSGQSFVTNGSKPGPQKTTLVETTLLDPAGQGVDLVYVARTIKGQWRIIDVLLDTGISEIARKRSEYRQVLKSTGVAGLIKTLEAKTDSLLID